MESAPLLLAALLAGLVGSIHCLAMCSGIAGALYLGLDQAESRGRRTFFLLTYNLGRILSYAMAGALLAWLGQSAGALSGIPEWAQLLRILAAFLLVLLGLQIASGWRLLSVLEQGGAKLWQKLSPLAARLVPVRKARHALGLGMLWGWLPCGLVYGVLPLAAAAGDVKSGALTMLLFGLGTIPAMLASASLTGFFATQRRKRSARMIAGILIILLGLAAAWSPLRHWSGTGTHHHAMISGI